MNGRASIEATIGDITAVDVDVIVNAANNELWMGSGVAGATKRAGGEEIEREAMSQGSIRVGQAVVTGPGQLPFKRVIHAAAMGYENGQHIAASAETVKSATSAALRLCDEHGFSSIAFPRAGHRRRWS